MAKRKSKNISLPKRAAFLTPVIIGVIAIFFLLNTKFGFLAIKQLENPRPETINQEEVVISEGEATKNWKVYRHKEMGFSIKYPADTIAIQRETEDYVLFTLNAYKNDPPPVPVSLFIAKRDVEDNDPASAVKGETPGGAPPTKFVEARINNAYGVKTSSGFASDYNFYLNDKDKTGPVLRVDVGNVNSSDFPGLDLSDFITMLSTFRFER